MSLPFRFEEETIMRRLYPILLAVGFRLRANVREIQKRFPTGFLSTFALCAGLVLFPSQAKAAYVATELAVLTEATTHVVRAVNGSTEVVGGARLGSGPQGYLLDGRVVPIGSTWGSNLSESDSAFQTRALAQPVEGFPGSDYSTAYDINDFGDIAGAANTATGLRAFRSHRATDYIELRPLAGDTSSAAFGINLLGQIVGYSSGPNGARAVIWNSVGTVQPLPAPSGNGSRALAINDSGDVVGVSEMPSGPRATLWAARGTARDLGTLPGHGMSEALSISENGDVVGSSGNLQQRRAVLWAQGGAIRNLGTLPGGASSRALGISKGQVVGTSETSNGEHAFLWTEAGGMQDLNSLLTSRSGFVLTRAVSINSQGIILAIGQNDNSPHEKPLRIFMLVPTP
jgi:probable HAF family extracellular repeat protein